MKIHPVGSEVFLEDGGKDRQTDSRYEVNSRFSQVCDVRLKKGECNANILGKWCFIHWCEARLNYYTVSNVLELVTYIYAILWYIFLRTKISISPKRWILCTDVLSRISSSPVFNTDFSRFKNESLKSPSQLTKFTILQHPITISQISTNFNISLSGTAPNTS
jgi:hypothetical protein